MNRSIPKPPSGYIAQQRTNKTRIPKISKIPKPPLDYKEYLNKQDVKKGIAYQLGQQQSANEKKGGSQERARDSITEWKRIPKQLKEYPGNLDLQNLENKQIKHNIGKEFSVTDAKEEQDSQKDISRTYHITAKYNYDTVNMAPSKNASPSNTISDTMESWARKKQWNKIVREAAKIGEARELAQKKKKALEDAKILNQKKEASYPAEQQEMYDRIEKETAQLKKIRAIYIAKHKRKAEKEPKEFPRGIFSRPYYQEAMYWPGLRTFSRRNRMILSRRSHDLKIAPPNTLPECEAICSELQRQQTYIYGDTRPNKKSKPNSPGGQAILEHQPLYLIQVRKFTNLLLDRIIRGRSDQ